MTPLTAGCSLLIDLSINMALYRQDNVNRRSPRQRLRITLTNNESLKAYSFDFVSEKSPEEITLGDVMSDLLLDWNANNASYSTFCGELGLYDSPHSVKLWKECQEKSARLETILVKHVLVSLSQLTN